WPVASPVSLSARNHLIEIPGVDEARHAPSPPRTKAVEIPDSIMGTVLPPAEVSMPSDSVHCGRHAPAALRPLGLPDVGTARGRVTPLCNRAARSCARHGTP